MKIMYYMPLFLAKKAQATQDEQLLDFCELFKVVNRNASVIDRTETLSTPFTYFNQYPVPQQRKPDADFAQTCIQRAKDILAEGKPTVLMYSGGIDSTCVALAFIYAIKAGIGSFDQVTVAATPVSRIENPEFWSRYILPNFKLESAQDSLAACDLTKRYVQGENADQLFGSDRVMLNAWMLTTEYSRLNKHKDLPPDTKYPLNRHRQESV